MQALLDRFGYKPSMIALVRFPSAPRRRLGRGR